MVLHRIKEYFQSQSQYFHDHNDAFRPQPLPEGQVRPVEEEKEQKEGEECKGCRVVAGITMLTCGAAIPVLSYKDYKQDIKPWDPKDPVIAYGPKTSRIRPKHLHVMYCILSGIFMTYGSAKLLNIRFKPVKDYLDLDIGI